MKQVWVGWPTCSNNKVPGDAIDAAPGATL